jgi:hypothetical protein
MPISWNEIRHNAIQFARDWAGAESERAEKQTFWNEFFGVFGIRRRVVAAFEEPVKKISGEYGYIDLFWPGTLLVEHKTRGKDLGKAESQAFRYIRDLIREGRQDDVPRYVIVSDFARIALHDLEPEEQGNLPLFDEFRVQTSEFGLAELHRHIHEFAFISGYQQHRFQDQDPINLRAVGIMGDLHDVLKAGGYKGHELERFLVRILFCLFAQDTGIFEREAFRLYIEDRTKPDGSDLGLHLARLFEVLNTSPERRQENLDESLAVFPYVNGDLFAEKLGFADFNRDMRNSVLACTRFNWSQISPAVFGSLFQGVMDAPERRQIGGHYTSERDILKVIRALFLDDLRAEFQRIKDNKNQLKQFHGKLAELRFLDPACGCGNFLVIAYRELRLLETEVLDALNGRQQQLDIQHLSRVDVDAFYGIEIGEWPARIAEVAMWLMDHQMNIRLSEAFGQYFVRVPLTKSPTIVCGNALRLDWKEILATEKCKYVLGNPPFVGGKYQAADQRADMDFVAGEVPNSGLLDYVTGWYFKAAEYIRGTKIVVGFVSTNSISQGEQVGTLWNPLFQRFGLKIHFAHRTFPWESEARGKAHVHVVIIGFAAFDANNKRIYECQDGKTTVTGAKNISPYLVEGPDRALVNRQKPLCGVPEIGIGNKPIDGGYYLFTPEERAEFLKREPAAAKLFRRWIGSDEFINGIERWCLWLGDCSPKELRELPESRRLAALVAKYRRGEIPAKGKADTERHKKRNPLTQKLADTPTRFHVENMPKGRYLVLPEVSSERRRYIPIGFAPPRVLCSNLVKILPGATRYHFGVLSSAMHMAWVRQVCGRLESRYRYSAKLVYNNYSWPETPTTKQRAAVEAAAQAVLDAREEYLRKGATLADIYDPLVTPLKLAKAHVKLDRAVDRCYRTQPFTSERQRVEFLFALYEKLTAPLTAPSRKKNR